MRYEVLLTLRRDYNVEGLTGMLNYIDMDAATVDLLQVESLAEIVIEGCLREDIDARGSGSASAWKVEFLDLGKLELPAIVAK